MNDFRYNLDAEGVVTRGQIQRYGDDDTWANYWDGDQMIAFTVDWHYGWQHANLVTSGNDVSDVAERIVAAFERTGADVLDRMARLITDSEDARFVHVALDRGQDMYALSWNGDPDNVWRDEIEHVYNHEVYRIVADRQISTVNGHDPLWLEDESDCTEYYGEDAASEELAKQFPLDEYPAETMVGATD